MRHKKFTSSQIEEIKKKKRKILKVKIIIIFVILISLFLGFGFLSKIDKFNVNKIEITGNKVLDSKDLEQYVKNKIEGNYFYLYSKSNIFLLSREKIKKDLIRDYRRIEDLSFDFNNLQILKINIKERTPFYIWCGEDISFSLLKPQEYRCKFMDNNGYVFDYSPYFSGDVYFRFFGNLDNYYFSKENFNDFILFKDNLSRIDIKAVGLYKKLDGEIELYLSSNKKFEEGPKIIFNIDSNYSKIFQNLESAVKTEPLKSDFKNKYSSLEYIDLRFNNKVYYKFK